ncbi:SMP-30/gluconolactonase/LRE family protein [Lacinutrix undariae]
MKYSLTFATILLLFSCNTKKENATITNSHQTELEYKIEAKLGEGAIWNTNTQELYWVDIEGKKLHTYNPETQQNTTSNTPSRIGTVVPTTKKDTVVVALQDGIYFMNTKTGDLKLLSDVEQQLTSNRFNDGKCDPSGRLWVGSVALDETTGAANLYMVDALGNAELKKDNVTISNGIVWTKNKKTMYYIDTPTAEIKAYDYDDTTGEISNERVAVKVPNSLGFPDGMTIDENDHLWVAMWNGNAVICFDPKTGKVISKIEVPAHNVTSCAFGGKNFDILYITTASVDMTAEEHKKHPLAGSIFKTKTKVKGVKANHFITE